MDRRALALALGPIVTPAGRPRLQVLLRDGVTDLAWGHVKDMDAVQRLIEEHDLLFNDGEMAMEIGVRDDCQADP